MVLYGSEVKAIREGKANIKEAYVRFIDNELFAVGMHIGKYSNEGYSTHSPIRDRKLLLHKRELSKIRKLVEEKGKTTVGQAADTDTLVASANAYLNALNKMIIKRKRTAPEEYEQKNMKGI